MNGIGERTGNANLVTITANLQVKLGHEVLPPAQPRAPDGDRALRRRAAQPRAEPEPAVRRPQRVRAQGRHAHRRRPRRRDDLRAHRPDLVGNRRELVVSELAGRGTVLEKAQDAGLDGRRPDGRARPRAASRSSSTAATSSRRPTASFELLIRKESGDYEPLFRLESWRVIVEQRADGKVDTEATIKVWLDGERYVRTAEGNGPVNALDAALRSAIGEIHPHLRDIELVNYKVRILDEAQGHRRDHAGAHRRHRRRAGRGARSACARTSSPRPGRRWSTRSSTPSSPAAAEAAAAARRALVDGGPAGPAGAGRAGGAGGPRGPAVRAAVAGAARAGVRAALRRPPRRAARERGVARAPPACTSRCARSASTRRRRGRHVAVLVRRAARTSSLYERRHAGLRRHRPA